MARERQLLLEGYVYIRGVRISADLEATQDPKNRSHWSDRTPDWTGHLAEYGKNHWADDWTDG